MKEEEEHFGEYRVFFWSLVGIFLSALIGNNYLQAEMVRRANQSSLDISLKAAQEKLDQSMKAGQDTIQKVAEEVVSKVSSKNEDADKLERRIIGAVHQTFERPGQIKRDLLLEVVRILVNEGIVDSETAKAMNQYIDQHYGGSYSAKASGIS